MKYIYEKCMEITWNSRCTQYLLLYINVIHVVGIISYGIFLWNCTFNILQMVKTGTLHMVKIILFRQVKKKIKYLLCIILS